MRFNNKVLMSAVANDGNKESDFIDTSQVYAISLLASFTDAAAAGTLKFQGSNDVPADQIKPNSFAPTNWADILNASVAVAAGANATLQVSQLCYRWVRVTWTRSAGAGTFTVRINQQGF